MDKKRKNIIRENKVSDLYEWSLGGYKQKVLVEGKTKQLPILITLHGGPGTPVPFSVGCRGLFPEFTERFIMVYWDQLGCGCNNFVITDFFTIDSFVQMTMDLVYEIKKLFKKNKIYLFAMSWGSILSAKLLEKESHIVDGVVVYGQIVRDIFFNDETIMALEKSKLPKRKLAVIKAAKKESTTNKELQLFSASIRKYTSGYQNKEGTHVPIAGIIKGLLTSPDYKIKDFKAIMINGYRKNRSLWKEILQLDLSRVLQSVQVPYSIFQGDTDIVTSTKIVKELVRTSNNDCLHCEIVEKSGHIPSKECMDRIFARLCEFEK